MSETYRIDVAARTVTIQWSEREWQTLPFADYELTADEVDAARRWAESPSLHGRYQLAALAARDELLERGLIADAPPLL